MAVAFWFIIRISLQNAKDGYEKIQGQPFGLLSVNAIFCF